jgi:hypothetical protein
MPTDRPASLVAPFAQRLLAADLPDLPLSRLGETVDFVARRSADLPSFTRAGVTILAGVFRGVMALPGGWPIITALIRVPLPLVAEYPRLVRSLGYAYVFETWPASSPSGAPS